MNADTLAQAAVEHTLLFLLGQLILFIFILVGAFAVGKRFINQEYPGFVQRVESGMTMMKSEMSTQISSVKSELLLEMNQLRKDLFSLREQFIRHEIDYAKQITEMSFLDRRVTKLENRLDNDETQSFRRRKGDSER